MSVSQSENVNDMHFERPEKKKRIDLTTCMLKTELILSLGKNIEARSIGDHRNTNYMRLFTINRLMVFSELIKTLCRPKCLNRRKYKNLKTAYEYV